MEYELRIIARSTIWVFWEQPDYSDSEQPLKSCYAIAERTDWSTPRDVKNQFRHASIIGDSRVVFNIAGNKYQLVLKFN